MDEFLRDTNTAIFREWVLLQQSEEYELYLNEQDQDSIIIETKYGQSRVTFHPKNIIELSITNKSTKESEFYIHFQVNTIKHAVDLFYEMLDSAKKVVNKPSMKVLLSCSGGLTTSFYTSKIEEAAQILQIDMEVSAIGYNNLFEIGEDYDVILLAPQIHYVHAKVQEALKNKIILKIPTVVYATYDVAKIIALITNSLHERTHS